MHQQNGTATTRNFKIAWNLLKVKGNGAIQQVTYNFLLVICSSLVVTASLSCTITKILQSF